MRGDPPPAEDELRAGGDAEVVAAALQSERGCELTDRTVALAAVAVPQPATPVLAHAAAELRADKEVVTAAAKQNPESTKWAAMELRADADFWLSLVQLHPNSASSRITILENAAEKIRAEVAARADK